MVDLLEVEKTLFDIRKTIKKCKTKNSGFFLLFLETLLAYFCSILNGEETKKTEKIFEETKRLYVYLKEKNPNLGIFDPSATFLL